MKSSRYQKLWPSTALAVSLALPWASVSWAGVVVEETLRVEGTGMMRFANMTGTTTTTVETDRARVESEIEMDSRLMRMAARAAADAEIVRLDQGVVYELNLRRQRYSETSLAEQAEAMAEAREQMRNAQRAQQQGATGVNEGQCEWSEPVSSIDRSGELDNIAGFSAERVSFTTTQSCTLAEPAQVCEYRLTLDQWVTTDAAASEALAELNAYRREYARQLGLDMDTAGAFAQQGAAFMGGYESLWEELVAFASELEGHSLRSRMSLAIGGPECEAMRQAESGMAGVGESIGSAVGGALGGVLGRQRDRGRRAEEEAESAPSGELVEFMSIQNETVSITRTTIEPSVFEVPADFRRAR